MLKLCGEGWSNARIAEELGLQEGTVRNYVSEAISKSDATNRVDAARIARDKGGYNRLRRRSSSRWRCWLNYW
ncbi:MAG: response regulator transcription factor, partial [Pseudomonadales bacterium]